MYLAMTDPEKMIELIELREEAAMLRVDYDVIHGVSKAAHAKITELEKQLADADELGMAVSHVNNLRKRSPPPYFGAVKATSWLRNRWVLGEYTTDQHRGSTILEESLP